MLTKGIFKKLFSSFWDANTKEVFKKSGISLIIKVVGVLVLFLNSVFLAKHIGANGLGVVQLAKKTSLVLLIICAFGMPQFLLKNVAISFLKKENKKIYKMMSSTLKLGGIISLIIISLFVFFVWIFVEENMKIPFTVSGISVIPQVFILLLSFGILGFRKVWQSNLFNETLAIFFIGFSFLFLFSFNIQFSAEIVLYIYMFCYVLVLLCVYIYWKKIFNFNYTANRINYKEIVRKSFPFLVVNGSSVIASNIDIMMIGWYIDTTSVGLYAVAMQIALLTSFFLQVSNSAISPKIAQMYSARKIKELSIMIKKSTLFLIIIGFCCLLFFSLLGDSILGIWGEQFKEAYIVLIILSIGQFFNIGTGCAGYVLMMCGYEKIQQNISVVSILCNVVLNIVLIINYGIVGAAIATTITLILENLFKVYYAKKKTGIMTLPLFN